MRQRTVREESTKDKAGALPPAIYRRQQDFNKVDLMAGLGLTSEEDEEEAVLTTSEGWGCDRSHICG